MKKHKVSFDFDNTLTKSEVQEYCKDLIKQDLVDVCITTRRYGENSGGNPVDPWWTNIGSKNWEDVYKLADDFGIKRENIHFCNMSDKANFFKDNLFLWHLDDDKTEIEMINEIMATKGVLCQPYRSWKWQCDQYIKDNLK